jgi:hypothetical protein
VTIILVVHVGKNETSQAVRRVLGSVAWVNAVRAAWIVAEREEDAGKRLLLPLKGNLAPRRRGLMYQLMPLSEAEQNLALAGIKGLAAEDFDRLKRQLFRVAWFGETDADADDVFAATVRRPDRSSDRDRAKAWLQERLANGPVPSNTCVEEGNAELGINKPLKWWQSSILKDKLGGSSKHKGFGPDGVWYVPPRWASLPSLSEGEGKTMQNHREINREGREAHRGGTWIAPDADPASLVNAFPKDCVDGNDPDANRR